MISFVEDIKKISRRQDMHLELKWSEDENADMDMSHITDFNLNMFRKYQHEFVVLADNVRSNWKWERVSIIDVTERSIKLRINLELEESLFGHNMVFEKPPSPKFSSKSPESWQKRQIAEVY